MYQTLNVSGLSARDRFAAWQEVMARTHMPIYLNSDHADNFQGSLRAVRFSTVGVSALTYSPLRANRTAKLVRQSDPECYQLSLSVHGELHLAQAGRETTARVTDLVLYDTWRPFHGRAHVEKGTVTAIQVQIPRQLLPLPSDQVDRMAAVRLPTTDGVGALLGQFLIQVTRDADSYRPADATQLRGILVDLIAMLLAQHLDAEAAVPTESKQRALLLQIHAHIERNLADPKLSPATIAAAHHISVRTLNRLFQAKGTAVSDWIRTRRLERCRHDLTDPRHQNSPIRTIAARWGYPHAGNFTRAFRTAYGLNPDDYRRRGGASV